jgi:limonene-1,2-epoxide hydrolase
MSAADRFRAAVEARDFEAGIALLADDVVFRSPVVHEPYQGRDVVAALLRAVAQIFEDFRYERQIGAPDAADHALVFRTRIGDREIEGCDFIHENGEGLIDELVVMVRPLTGAHALADAMRAHFEGAGVPAP